ncbi:SCO family protein [Desulfogranum japonicum]|uniref:SCO family protein n=1 Tax=Desulfogranum japonicum TaxID=231447 RepID=UPI0012946B35|nr:SCO family protein [Desulfogranum japonicum]
MKKTLTWCFLLMLLMQAGSAISNEEIEIEVLPAATGVMEKTGTFLPLDTTFINENAQSVSLREIINKPTLLLPVYYTCPQICSFDMANLAIALQQTSISPENFNVITLSFNHRETAEDAARTKKNYTSMLENQFPTENWHFLTGQYDNIKKVTDAIGYTFKPAEDGLFLHPSALVAIGSDGKIIKYVYGSFVSGDVDLALSEAEKGTPATSIKRFLAYCLSGEVKQNKTVFFVLKTSVIVLLCIGGYFLYKTLRRKDDDTTSSS